MGYSKNALREIIRLSKQWGFEGRYMELDDERVLTLKDFCPMEAIGDDPDPFIDFPCERCGKFYGPEKLNAQEPYLNYCEPCIEIEEEQKEKKEYFGSLKRKGILEDYRLWIEKLYPDLFRKYCWEEKIL